MMCGVDTYEGFRWQSRPVRVQRLPTFFFGAEKKNIYIYGAIIQLLLFQENRRRYASLQIAKMCVYVAA
jgi:hypothetical protein